MLVLCVGDLRNCGCQFYRCRGDTKLPQPLCVSLLNLLAKLLIIRQGSCHVAFRRRYYPVHSSVDQSTLTFNHSKTARRLALKTGCQPCIRSLLLKSCTRSNEGLEAEGHPLEDGNSGSQIKCQTRGKRTFTEGLLESDWLMTCKLVTEFPPRQLRVPTFETPHHT